MSRHILIVDDERAVRDLLQDLFTYEGYRVDLAEDGIDALRKIERHAPDLIILDIMMPGLDGYGTLMALEQRGLAIPVLVMCASPSAMLKALPKLGPDFCLAKPFDIDVLLARARQLLAAS